MLKDLTLVPRIFGYAVRADSTLDVWEYFYVPPGAQSGYWKSSPGYPITTNSVSPNKGAYSEYGTVSSTWVNSNKKTPHAFSYSYNRSYAGSSYNHLKEQYVPDHAYRIVSSSGHLDYSPGAAQFQIDHVSARDALWMKIVDGFRNSDFNAGVSLGEARETSEIGKSLKGQAGKAGKELYQYNKRLQRNGLELERLTKKFGNTAKYYQRVMSDRSAGKASVRVVRKATRMLADAYLTYSHGIRPIINDYYAVLDLLKNRQQLYGGTFYKQKTINRVATGKKLVGYPDVDSILTDSERCVIKIAGTYYVDNPLLALADRIGLANPFALGYELVRLSFVVDMFIDIGTYLDHVGVALSGTYSLKDCYCTTYRESYRSGYKSKFVNAPPALVSGYKYAGLNKAVICTRTVHTSIPLPSVPPFKVPNPFTEAGRGQLLSCAALLRSIGLNDLDRRLSASKQVRATGKPVF
jgi:hypothetical protein